MKSNLKVAIVGTGAIAHVHAKVVAEHEHVSLVAVTDLSRSAGEAFAADHGVRAVYDDLDSLLQAECPHVVLVCTPPGAHSAQAAAAFAAGAHVVVEKPPAASLVELDEMLAAAAAADRELIVVFQQRTGTAAAHARALLSSGKLGRPLIGVCETLWYRDQDYFDVPWRGKWETEGGGPTLGHGIHQIDLLAYLLGDWTSVSARLWRLDRDTGTEDASTATVTFANGAIAQITTSAVSPRESSAIRIDTQRATITVNHRYGHGHENWSITKAKDVHDSEADTWVNTAQEERSGHEPFLRDVFDALLAGDPLPETTSSPSRSFEIVAAIYASAAADGALITSEDLVRHPTHRRSFESPVIDRRGVGGGCR